MYHYYTCLLIWCGRHGVWRCTRLLNTKWAWEYGTHGDFKFFYFFFLLVGFFFYWTFWYLGVYLVILLKLTFLHFKQHYIFFHIFFHSHMFQKTLNNNSQTHSSNRLLIFDTSFKICEMGCASKVSHMRFTSWFLFLFICLFKLF